MAQTLLTTHAAHGGRQALCIYQQDNAYHVALLAIDPQSATAFVTITPLDTATFWTYDAAHTRLIEEVRQRQW